MTLLAELFDRLEHAPMAAAQRQIGVLVGGMEVGAATPAFTAHQRPAEPPPTSTTPVPTQNVHAQNMARTEGVPVARRNAWTITRGDKPVCTICGSPMIRTEALAEAHWRWPDADLVKE